MHGTLSAATHGILDYVAVVTFALAPTLFAFSGAPALLAYALAAVHLGLTLATRFPMGMFDGVTFRAHGVVELVVSVALVVLPWIAGFTQAGAQWFYPLVGIAIFVVWILTDYGRPHHHPPSGAVDGGTPGRRAPSEEPEKPAEPRESKGPEEPSGPDR